MKLPVELRERVADLLGCDIMDHHGVTGGCISETARLELGNGTRAFMKWAAPRDHTVGLFREEARSLRAIATSSTVRVPNVLHVEDDPTRYAFLLLEWLEPGAASARSWRLLGEQLAALHRNQNGRFGWESSNFIGSLSQSNNQYDTWPEFWRDERLMPQLEKAESQFSTGDVRRFHRLFEDVHSLISAGDQEGASLLHGDLWNGNVHMLSDGGPAVIDPSSYYGHREVDLAMSRLFGGFGKEFYDAYDKAWPLSDGAEHRIHVYQLYYLLVHVNLFGGSYVGTTMNAVKRLGF